MGSVAKANSTLRGLKFGAGLCPSIIPKASCKGESHITEIEIHSNTGV